MKQLGFTLHIKKQPKVSSETKTAVQEEIKIGIRLVRTQTSHDYRRNNEALLQRIRLIQNAREEIILSTLHFTPDGERKADYGSSS